jgi:hypothetical protein
MKSPKNDFEGEWTFRTQDIPAFNIKGSVCKVRFDAKGKAESFVDGQWVRDEVLDFKAVSRTLIVVRDCQVRVEYSDGQMTWQYLEGQSMRFYR